MKLLLFPQHTHLPPHYIILPSLKSTKYTYNPSTLKALSHRNKQSGKLPAIAGHSKIEITSVASGLRLAGRLQLSAWMLVRWQTCSQGLLLRHPVII